MTTLPQGLDEFVGLWRIERRIDDRMLGLSGIFAGTAEFTSDAQGLICSEEGMLSYGSAEPLPATRRYLWRMAGGRVEIRFEDERPLVGFALNTPQPHDRHFCEPDSYDAAFDFARWPEWSSTWKVRGPRKDYRMVSSYFRVI